MAGYVKLNKAEGRKKGRRRKEGKKQGRGKDGRKQNEGKKEKRNEPSNELLKIKQANKERHKQALKIIIKLPVNLPCLLIVTKFRINVKISRHVITAGNKKFPLHPFIFRYMCINALVSLYSASDIFSGSRSRLECSCGNLY